MSFGQRIIRVVRNTDRKLLIIIGVIAFFLVAGFVIHPWVNLARVLRIVIMLPAFLMGITIHEAAHGWTAWKLGDPTAKDAGRITLNPFKHLSLFGTLAIFIIRIGWAKPVPVNPLFFKNPRRDKFLVSVAGPLSNLLQAICAAALIGFITRTGISWPVQIPGFRAFDLLHEILSAFLWVGLILMIFNLLPIPPLDGSKILESLLPSRFRSFFKSLESVGPILLVILVWWFNLGAYIFAPINYLSNLLISIF